MIINDDEFGPEGGLRKPLSPGVKHLLHRAAALLDPGPVPARLADLINPRFHDRPNHEETGIED